MDDTAASYSNRANAKRAAEKMITAGTAPAVDYGIKPREDGRFEIKWKTNRAPATEQQVKAELTAATETATADSAPATEPAATTDPSPTEPEPAAAGDGEPGTTESAEPEQAEDPFPAGTWVKVRQGKRMAIVGRVVQRIDPQTWRVHQFGKPEEWTRLATAAQLYRTEEPTPEPPKPERRSRRHTAVTPSKPSRSQYTISVDMIATGKLPEKPPVVTSKANPHYQKRFDTLHGLAVAGDWKAVRDYKVSGSNSYSKMLERYRQDLVAIHAASKASR